MELQEYTYFITVNFIKLFSFLSVVYIIFKLKSSKYCGVSMKYFQIYFFFAFVLTTLSILGGLFKLPIEISNLVFFYVLTTLFLIYALYENMSKKIVTFFVSIGLVIFAIITFLIGLSDLTSMINHIVFSITLYSFLTYIALKKAMLLNNIGYKIMSSAFILIIFIALFEVYQIYYGDIQTALSYARFSANTAFILVIIGFLAINIVQENQYLNNLALKDTLTGMHNRRGLDYMLAAIVPSSNRSKRCFSVITIDIDFFKKINDTYGHDGGDVILVEFAKMIKTNHRNNDISCRMGGEEFILVLPDTDKDEAVQMAEKLRKHIENHTITFEDKLINITASFGVATSCDEIDIDLLIKDSDRAVYISKYAGRNMVAHIDDHCII